MVKKALRLISPLFIFYLLLIPYSIVNREFIVEWFGCGCPKTDELGNIIHPDFNANDFTALFWFFITMCVTVVAVFLSKRLNKSWQRFTYIALMLTVSMFISYSFIQLQQWN